MRMTIHAQAVRRFDTPVGAYLRDVQGRMAPPAGEVTVEATPYRGQAVAERWPAEVTPQGQLQWTVPKGTRLGAGLYTIRARAGDQLIAQGLLEVV